MTDETGELARLREENARLKANSSDKTNTAAAPADAARKGPPSEQDQDANSRAQLSVGGATEAQRGSDVADHVHVGPGHGASGDVATGGVYREPKADTAAS